MDMKVMTYSPIANRAGLIGGALAALILSCSALAQDVFYFSNYEVDNQGVKHYVPIYLPEPSNSTLELEGNSPVGVPAGTTEYHGAIVTGTGFTAELWAAPLGFPEDQMVLIARTTFKTATVGPGVGAIEPVVGTLPVVTAGQSVSFQMRVYENRGGTITSWSQVQGDPTLLRGDSEIFSSPSAASLGRTGVIYDMFGLRSFNLHTQVPEPAALAIGALGIALLLLWHRRHD